MAFVAMGAAAAAAGIQAYGQLQQGKSQNAMYQYQAGVADVNATIAKQNADFSRAAGETEAEKSAMQTRQVLGKIRTGQGASGLDVNTGTNLKVQTSQADVGAHDVDVIRSNAARRAYGYEVEAYNKKTQGELYRYAGANAKRASKIAALGSIVGGAANVAGKWTQASQAGALGSSSSGGGEDDFNWNVN